MHKSNRWPYIWALTILAGLLVGRAGRSSLFAPAPEEIWNAESGTAPIDFCILAFPRDGRWSVPLLPARSVLLTLDEYERDPCCNVTLSTTRDVIVPREEFTTIPQPELQDQLVDMHIEMLNIAMDPLLRTLSYESAANANGSTAARFTEQFSGGGNRTYTYEVSPDGSITPISIERVEPGDQRSTAFGAVAVRFVGFIMLITGSLGLWIPILNRKLKRR